MTELKPSSINGFTLLELIVVIIIVAILSSTSIASYRRHRLQESLKSINRELHAAMEGWRKLAMQESYPCQINFSNSYKDLGPPTNASGEPILLQIPKSSASIETTLMFNACASATGLRLDDVNSSGSRLTTSIEPQGTTGILFSFRGLSEAVHNSAQPNITEIRLGLEGLDEQRCFKLMHPLGLMRLGRAPSTTKQCSYQSAR